MRVPVGRPVAVGRRLIDLKPELFTAILQTIDAGWEIALKRPEVKPDAGEVQMTECLRDAMREALISKKLPWRKTMIIAPGTESRSQPGMTVPDGRTDIPLFLTTVFAASGEHDPHAIIECKRVAEGDAHLAREYVVEGIDRFRTGKYAANHARGFMVGYVVAGASNGVVDGINKYLAGRRRKHESLESWTVAGVVSAWISHHDRPSSSTQIRLHHAMALVPGC